MKKIVFDSSSLISLSEKCFMNIVGKLASKTNTEFLIPSSVLKETVNIPLKIKKFELNAIRIRTAIKNNWIKAIKPNNYTRSVFQKLANITADICFADQNPFQIIHEGELEAIALTKTTNAKALVIDERTTRMLVEEPHNLIKLLEFRTKKKIKLDEQKLFDFQKTVSFIPILRSSEILAVGYENNCFENELEQNKNTLKAALFAVKFAGCAISEQEIEEYTRFAK